jgi:hypothetical protein
VNFAPTSHDPLAQSPGRFTFHFEADNSVWECLGAKETGADTFVLPDDAQLTRAEDVPATWEEICRTGVESDQPIRFTLRPIMARDSRGRSGPAALPPGDYQLRVLLLDPASTAPDQRVFDVTVDCGTAGAGAQLTERVDIFRLAGHKNRMIARPYRLTLRQPDAVEVTLKPVTGKAMICGAVLQLRPK